eukprot:4029197-Pleurochrysis_carterae.AAC.2
MRFNVSLARLLMGAKQTRAPRDARRPSRRGACDRATLLRRSHGRGGGAPQGGAVANYRGAHEALGDRLLARLQEQAHAETAIAPFCLLVNFRARVERSLCSKSLSRQLPAFFHALSYYLLRFPARQRTKE